MKRYPNLDCNERKTLILDSEKILRGYGPCKEKVKIKLFIEAQKRKLENAQKSNKKQKPI